MSDSIDFELLHDEFDKNKKAVLLFHGLTGSPFEMRKYGNFLFQNGYDVFCYSFPGHGDRLDEIQNVSDKDWCDFAQQKYNQLRLHYDIFYVSGLCLGAAMAIYLAENNSDVTGVMALSTTLFLDGASMPWYIFLMPLAVRTILRYYYTFPEDNSLGVKNELTRKSLAKIMSKTTVGMDNYPLCCVKGLLKLSKNVRKNLKKVTCPVLVVHSKYDNLASTKGAKIVMNGVSSIDKKYVELTDSFHMILYDNEKKFVMNQVLEFVTRVTDFMQKEERELVACS